MQPLSPETAFTSVRWVPVRNGNGSDAPAFGLVRVTGSGTDGVTDVDQPNADGQQVWVAGYGGVDAGVVGVATSDFPAWALYDSGDGTPAVGETWGAGNGSWKLRKGTAGFRVCGTPDATNTIVPVERQSSGVEHFLARLTSTYSSGYSWKRRTVTSGTGADYSPSRTGTNNAFTPDGDTSLASGTDGYIFADGAKWVFVPATSSGGSAQTGWFARLTTASGGRWKYYKLTLDVGGAEDDDGSEAADYTAVPFTIDGTDFATDPVAGMRVWMWESKQTGFQEFLPLDGRPPELDEDSDILGSDFAVGDNTGWVDVSDGAALSVTLPAAGSYLVWYSLSANLAGTGDDAGLTIHARLYDGTAEVAGTAREVVRMAIGTVAITISSVLYESEPVAQDYVGAAAAQAVYTAAASKTIKLQAKNSQAYANAPTTDILAGATVGYLKLPVR